VRDVRIYPRGMATTNARPSRASMPEYGCPNTVQRDGAGNGLRCRLGWHFVVRDSGTSVFLEVLLGDAVEGERRDTTLQARSDDTPVTVGTAPAGELFVFDPDHASCHACTLRG